jgi:hypothetical protein
MTWSWFDLAWPWIGSAAAVLLIVLLFGTNKLRSNLPVSRWRDPVWLAWAAATAYMIHNVEEYGIDMFGRVHAFPDALCTTLRLGAYPDCPVPPAFYLAVNIALIWVAGPLAALLSRRHALIGYSFFGLEVTNGMAHVVPMLLGRGYSPGTLSAILLFFPLFIWVARTQFGAGRIPYKGLAAIVFAGVVCHAILIGSIFAFLGGLIGATVLVALQIVNAAVFLSIPWTAGRLLRLSRAQ